jgi:hypothetical protein
MVAFFSEDEGSGSLLSGLAAKNQLITNSGLRELFVPSLSNNQIGTATVWNHGISVRWPACLPGVNNARLLAHALTHAYETVARYFRSSTHSVRARSCISSSYLLIPMQ